MLIKVLLFNIGRIIFQLILINYFINVKKFIFYLYY